MQMFVNESKTVLISTFLYMSVFFAYLESQSVMLHDS